MASVLLSDITFRRADKPGVLQLRLASPIDRKPGVSPGVVRAFASHAQVRVFGDDLGGEGAMTLYDGNDAGQAARKVVLRGYRIVDAYPATLDVTGDPVEWEVFLADHRRIFAKPLGGELDLGELNRAPVRSKPGDDGLRRDARGKEVVEPADLIALCLIAMDVTPVGGVPVIPADRARYTPTDLKWDGAWAPGELEELLKTFGLVFCPTIDGKFKLGVLGNTPWPNPPGPFVLTPLPAVGKPTDVIVFRSTPNPALETLNLRPGDPVGFEWVLPERSSDGTVTYLPVDEVEWLASVPGFPGAGTAIKALSQFFRRVPHEWQATLKSDLYRLARIPPSVIGIGNAPLDEVYDIDGDTAPAALVADAAILDTETATWSMPGEVVFPVSQIRRDVSGAIVVLRYQAFKLRDGLASTEDVTVWSEAAELTRHDGYLRVTREVVDAEGKPVYFRVGYRRDPDGAGGLAELTDDQMAGAARSAVVSTPSLVEITVHPEGVGDDQGDPTDNTEDLREQAVALARVYLGDRTAAAEVIMPGYWPVELSGAVSAVSYSQTPPETRYTVGGHFRPASGKAGTGGAAAVGHTPSRSTASAKAAAGSVDSAPRVRLLSDTPVAAAAGGEGGTFCHVDGREKGRGKYLAKIVILPEDNAPDSAVALPELGEDVMLINLGEIGSGPSHVLQAESVVGPVRFAGSLDMPPPEGSPEGTPRDSRRICYVAYERNVYRQFRTKVSGGDLLFQGSRSAQPMDVPAGENTPAIDDWQTLLTFKGCPPGGP